jgi:hypothetical protein
MSRMKANFESTKRGFSSCFIFEIVIKTPIAKNFSLEIKI